MARLSELEGCVLGLVHQKGPVTAYAIRRTFLDSPSPHWSGSAGAIYPLIRRLTRSRLVRSASKAMGARRSRLYSITPEGRRALRRWLGPPVPSWVAAVPADALRTRVGFMAALPPAARRIFVDEARAMVAEHIRIVEEDCRRTRASGDLASWFVARGALGMLRSRADWLAEVSRALEKP